MIYKVHSFSIRKMEYRGQIAIASIKDVVNDPYYKYKALIETGNLSKKECYVAYRKRPEFINENILVRFELPFEVSNLNLEGKLTSNFITSNLPKDFESSSSDDLIFYLMWARRMMDGKGAPILSKIRNFYDIGIIQSILHFGYTNDYSGIQPYRLHVGTQPEVMKNSDNKILSARDAIYQYLERMYKQPESQALPRVVTIDEKIKGLKSIVMEELHETGLTLIEMEPQQ